MNVESRTGKRLSLPALLVSILLISILAVWAPPGTSAQSAQTAAANQPSTPLTCAQVVPMVTNNLSAGCNNLDRDQVCYGNRVLTVENQDATAAPPFDQPGQIAPITAFKSITTSPLNLDRGEWGVAALKIKANLPGTTVGQAVTFILYGDTNVANQTPQSTETPPSTSCTAVTTKDTALLTSPDQNGQTVKQLTANSTVSVSGKSLDDQWIIGEQGTEGGWLPVSDIKLACDLNSLAPIDDRVPAVVTNMSAFYFTTGIGQQASCRSIPPGGLLVQSTKGTRVAFRANGVDITLGSTVILRAQPNGNMTVSVLEGQAVVSAASQQQTVNAGGELTIPLGGPNGLDASGPPASPYLMDNSHIAALDLSTVCALAQAIGLQVPCVLTAPATRPPRPTATKPQPTFTPTKTKKPSPTPTTPPTVVKTPIIIRTFIIRGTLPIRIIPPGNTPTPPIP